MQCQRSPFPDTCIYIHRRLRCLPHRCLCEAEGEWLGCVILGRLVGRAFSAINASYSTYQNLANEAASTGAALRLARLIFRRDGNKRGR